jgi:hypothetical protein
MAAIQFVRNVSKCLTFKNVGINGTISTRNHSSKVYELRTYSVKPECMKPFVDLTLEKLHIRTSFSVLHGYWTAELGGLNQVVHLWEYGQYFIKIYAINFQF